jgi:ribonuclease BN (tRNA processing enzyme)
VRSRLAAVLGVATLALVAACASTPTPWASAPSGTLVVLLGTGTPNAEPDRSGPALAVVVGGRSYLVDAGPGVVRRANAATQRGIEALAPAELRRAFLTHLHSDHTVGLPDLIFTPWVLDRDVPLEVWGPAGTAAMCEHVEAAYAEDVRVRLEGLQPANPEGWKVVAHEIGPGVVYRDATVTVEAFAVHHGSVEPAFGYRFTTPDGAVVVSGDTAAFDGMADEARGAALLVHEAYATAGWERRSPEWQRYHEAFHTPGRKVGEIAARAGVGAVVLTHELLWGATPEQLVDEVRSAYRGPVFYGRDLDVFIVHAGHVSHVVLPPPQRP